MVITGRVYVPSAVEEDGTVVGMGCFSTQETALNVLRSFLKKSHQVPLQRASVASWDVDVVGDDAVTVLSEYECRTRAPSAIERRFGLTLNASRPNATGQPAVHGLRKVPLRLA